MKLDIAVLGPGGVGGLLAGLMARGGDSVVVLAGDDTARLIAERGLRIESERFGTFTASVRTAPRLTEAVDACFITVKATHLRDAMQRVPADSLGQAVVIPFLNGLDHVDVLRAAYPPGSVAPAAIRIETTRTEPGMIRHTSPFAAIEIAVTEQNRGRIEPIASHLQAAGFDVRLREDELAMLWDKFAIIAPLALLTTYARGNVEVVRNRLRAEAIAVIAEVVAIAQADGVVVDGESVLRLIDSAPPTFETSMQRDQAAGRPLELDAIGGALLRRAARRGIDVPVTRRLVDELQARTAAAVQPPELV